MPWEVAIDCRQLMTVLIKNGSTELRHRMRIVEKEGELSLLRMWGISSLNCLMKAFVLLVTWVSKLARRRFW